MKSRKGKGVKIENPTGKHAGGGMEHAFGPIKSKGVKTQVSGYINDTDYKVSGGKKGKPPKKKK